MLKYLELIGRLTNVPKTELIAKLTKNSEGTELIEESEVKSYIEQIFSNKINTVGNDNLKRGKREGLSDLEKSIRQKFNSTSTAQGIDLIESVVSNQIETVKAGIKPNEKGTADLTIEEVKKLPFFSSIVDEIASPLKDENSKVNKAFEDYKQSIEIGKKQNVVKEFCFDVWRKSKGIHSDKQSVLDLHFKTIDLNKFKVEGEGDNRKVTIVDENGNRLQDGLYNDIIPSDFIKSKWTLDFHKHDPNRSGTGGDSGMQGGTGGTSSGKWKNDSEFSNYIQDPKLTDQQRQTALVEYQASKKKE